MSNLIGQSLGRYHILEQLGEGGMATVYKAYDTRLERDVAIKVILAGKEQPERFLKRFEREARALAKLSHPNIVGVIDFGDQDGMPYLVMEHVPGGTLKRRLSGRPIPWAEAARLLAPIARALSYAHKQNIIHRDVKPSNILITASGEPMLSDFGIAKILEAEETLDLTGAGVGVGTPEYMSAEQAQGKPIDGRSDVYSLGVVFYEMVTGRKPYQADTPMAVIYKLASEPLPRPSQFVAGLPPEVERCLLKALARNPADRYQSMQDFAAALESLQAPVKAKAAVPAAPAAGRAHLSPVVVGILSGLAVLLIGFGLSRLPALRPASAPSRPAAASASGTPLSQAANSSGQLSESDITATVLRATQVAIRQTATATRQAAIDAFATQRLLSTPGTGPVAFQDQFDHAAFEGSFDPEVWQVSGAQGTQGSWTQFRDTIGAYIEPTASHDLEITATGAWSMDALDYVEWRIWVEKDIPARWASLGVGLKAASGYILTCDFKSTITDQRMACGMWGNNARYAPLDMGPASVTAGKWHTIRFQRVVDPLGFVFFLDGQNVGGFPLEVPGYWRDGSVRPYMSLGVENNTERLTGGVDYVIVGTR